MKRARAEPDSGNARELQPGEDWVEAYREAQGVLVIRAAVATSLSSSEPASGEAFGETNLAQLYAGLCPADRASFTVENAAATDAAEGEAFFDLGRPARGYCSFILQHGDRDALLGRVPLVLPESQVASVRHGAAVWVFTARNAGPTMQGRPLHTDSVAHDGTFHYQLRGSKRWNLERKGVGKFSVLVEQGDHIVVDTKAWLHQTEIPPQDAAGVSLSMARDLYIGREPAPEEDMTNMDGMYALEAVESGTVLFVADEHPDLELGRSSDPNCEVVELPNGSMAIASCRDIAAGEFFSVAESSDEEEDDCDNGEEEEEEGDDDDDYDEGDCDDEEHWSDEG